MLVLTDPPMNQRMGQPVCRRLKRNSFLHQAKEIINKTQIFIITPLKRYQHAYQPTPPPPWKSEALPNINMKILGIEDKRLQTPEEIIDITDGQYIIFT